MYTVCDLEGTTLSTWAHETLAYISADLYAMLRDEPIFVIDTASGHILSASYGQEA